MKELNNHAYLVKWIADNFCQMLRRSCCRNSSGIAFLWKWKQLAWSDLDQAHPKFAIKSFQKLELIFAYIWSSSGNCYSTFGFLIEPQRWSLYSLVVVLEGKYPGLLVVLQGNEPACLYRRPKKTGISDFQKQQLQICMIYIKNRVIIIVATDMND